MELSEDKRDSLIDLLEDSFNTTRAIAERVAGWIEVGVINGAIIDAYTNGLNEGYRQARSNDDLYE